MKKIGILTFHHGVNYGGTLQCYALQEVLRSMGYDVKVIDFRITRRRSLLKNYIDRFLSLSSFQEVGQIIYSIWKKTQRAPKRNEVLTKEEQEVVRAKFSQFRSTYLNLTDTVNERTIAAIANEFDVVVVGSDQIWADIYEQPATFLCEWRPIFKGVRIAYASCSPLGYIQRVHKNRVQRLMGMFSAISVRDKHTASLVYALGLNSAVVADPTMLLPNWQVSTPIIDGDYVLLYVLREEIKGGLSLALKKIREVYPNSRIVSILSGESSVSRFAEGIDEHILPSPLEWVNLIAHAKFLFTDSYHGCVFAHRFGIPFNAYYHTENNGKYRLLELGEQIEQKNRFISDAEDLEVVSKTSIGKKYIDFVADSMKWLSIVLEEKVANE